MEIKEIYERLLSTYTEGGRMCFDKARSFRTIYESFVEHIMPECQNKHMTLGPKAHEMFKNANIEHADILEDASKSLLTRLNIICHDDHRITEEELTDYYAMLLRIIYNITNVLPDEKSLMLSGIATDSILHGLNLEQKAAVLDDSQFINVNAGPGTGKTYLLVRKFLYYLKGNPEANIVALSFTNSAAANMKKRVFQELSEEYLAEHNKSNMDNCVTSTIHSYCYNLMSQYAEEQNEVFDYEILDDSVIGDIANDIAEEYSIRWRIDEIKEALEKNIHNGASEIVIKYKEQHHFIRVDEILDMFINKISSCDEFKAWLKSKIDFLLIDESQDLGRKVYVIIEKFYSLNPNMNMFFVGDPRQNIFAFNDGKYQNLLDFKKKLDLHPSEHTLKITYRCPKRVTDLVNRLAFIDCENPALEPDESVLSGTCNIVRAYDSDDEAKSIAKIVENTNDNNNICVLATGLWYLEKTAKWLNDMTIPFVTMGGKMIMKRSFKVINHCLRIVENNNENSVNFLKRMRMYDEKLSKKLQELGNDYNNLHQDLDILVQEISDYLLKKEFIMPEDKQYVSIYSEKAKNIKQIPNLLFACSSKKNDEFSFCYEKDFKVVSTAPITENCLPVTLSTIHSAKGLEWDNVVLAGVADRTLPYYTCYDERKTISETKAMINDDKKKYYVAVTRSHRNLYLTYPTTSKNRYGKVFTNKISPFVISH